jgi:hypothetical protein
MHFDCALLRRYWDDLVLNICYPNLTALYVSATAFQTDVRVHSTATQTDVRVHSTATQSNVCDW